jgi:hypothetical protein
VVNGCRIGRNGVDGFYKFVKKNAAIMVDDRDFDDFCGFIQACGFGVDVDRLLRQALPGDGYGLLTGGKLVKVHEILFLQWFLIYGSFQ